MAELQARQEFDTNTDGRVSEEEITILVGDGIDSVGFDQFYTIVWPKIKDVYKMPVVEEADPINPPPTEAPPAPMEDTSSEDAEDADFDEVSAYSM